MTSLDEPSINDDWDRHWSTFGNAVADNPASAYRSRLIVKLLGPITRDAVIIELGCGQGQLSLQLARMYPQAEVMGLDASAEGMRGAAEASAASKLSARFAQRDLTQAAELPDKLRERATVAICSEVLEHVDEPATLLRNASEYMAPGCRLVVTVPGGPRSAFDRHIGHRQHFTPARLRGVLECGGFENIEVRRAGFPFFDLYRLVVILRGRHLIADVEEIGARRLDEGASGAALHLFDRAFQYNLDSSPLGWQLTAVAYRGSARDR